MIYQVILNNCFYVKDFDGIIATNIQGDLEYVEDITLTRSVSEAKIFSHKMNAYYIASLIGGRVREYKEVC